MIIRRARHEELQPVRPVERLAVVTCYFNPQGYRRIRDNYARFAAGMQDVGAELWTVELAFDGDPWELSPGPSIRTPVGANVLRLRGEREKHLLWQKERLLNWLVARLPAEVEAVAWLDCDVLLLNPGWLEATREALCRYEVVQPWEEAYTLFPDGRLEAIRRSCAWHWQHDREGAGNFGVSHPGFAWAARREWLARHGLYEAMATGGGDCLIALGVMGALGGSTAEGRWLEGQLCPEWRPHVAAWGRAVYGDVRGSLGYVPGALLHLYHGSRKDRRYVERWRYLTDYGFGPAVDLRVGESGLLEWTPSAVSGKPEMVARVGAYFGERREDD